jgi:hypothetical protein
VEESHKVSAVGSQLSAKTFSRHPRLLYVFAIKPSFLNRTGREGFRQDRKAAKAES